MKQTVSKYSIILSGLIISGLTTTGCASSAETGRANNKTADETTLNKSLENVKKSGEAKPKENKSPVDNKQNESADENFQTETKEFLEAKGSGTGDLSSFAKWNFIVGSDRFEINADGRGKRTTGTNAVGETNFNLPLQGLNAIDSGVYFAQYKGDLVMLYGITDGESGGGSIVRLEGKTLKPKWSANINGFNVGKGLIENQSAYFGASGFAAKIDLESGKYIWKHSDLYRKYNKNGAFNSFEIPELEGDTVVFTEKQENAASNTIIFDKSGGKVIKANVN